MGKAVWSRANAGPAVTAIANPIATTIRSAFGFILAAPKQFRLHITNLERKAAFSTSGETPEIRVEIKDFPDPVFGACSDDSRDLPTRQSSP